MGAARSTVPAIELKDVSVSFERGGKTLPVLDGISLEVARGEFVAIVGPSGGGKTTLFNVISGLLRPTEGSVWVAGEQVQGPSGHVGYMLQKDLLLPWRTVAENVTLGLEIYGMSHKRARAEAIKQLASFGLEGFENAYPTELSGGMRQRIALIRTLVLDPDIMLLDEPFSALDYQTRLILEGELLGTLKERQQTVLLVTHDIGEAISLADRIIVLSSRPARVKAIYDMDLTLDGERTPLTARAAPEYNHYFTSIWNELDIQVATGGQQKVVS